MLIKREIKKMSLFKKNNIEKPEKPTPKWVSYFCMAIVVLALLALLVVSQSHWVYSFTPDTINSYVTNGENGHFIKDTTTLCNGTFFQMKHTVNGIPVCTEYYYLCGDSDTNTLYVVRADKNFYNNFNPSTGENESGVKLSGLIRTPSVDLRNAIARTQGEIANSEYEIKMLTKYIDLMSMRVAIGTLIGYILIGIAITIFAVFSKRSTDSKIVSPIAVISLVAGCFVLLHYINYIM